MEILSFSIICRFHNPAFSMLTLLTDHWLISFKYMKLMLIGCHVTIVMIICEGA